MKIRAILFVILFFFALFSTNCVAMSADLSEIQTKQKELSYLRHSDLKELVFFSGYDVYYDRNLQYNPKIRQLINEFDVAVKHAEQSNVSVAYYEFRNILNKMEPNDFYYMTRLINFLNSDFSRLPTLRCQKCKIVKFGANILMQ